MIIEITDPDDPRLAPFREVRERDLCGRGEGFIAEGKLVLAALAESRLHAAEALLIARERLGGVANLLARFGDDIPVYVPLREIMDEIVGFPIHRGVLGLGRRGTSVEPEALLASAAERALVLLLIGVSNHDNMGGLFRNAAAFGAAGVLLDPTACDPLYRKAIRVSAGHALKVPFARLSPGEDPIALLEAAGFDTFALSPKAATPLSAMARPARAALVLGPEGEGLPPSLLDRCESLRIEMAPRVDSLNVSTAAGIAMHHLAFASAAP
ncbi:MAG: TrmH family RNA methyltransferase [Caulobacteraceae bacterium]